MEGFGLAGVAGGGGGGVEDVLEAGRGARAGEGSRVGMGGGRRAEEADGRGLEGERVREEGVRWVLGERACEGRGESRRVSARVRE